MSTSALAVRELLIIPAGQVWINRDTTRSGNYSTVTSRVYAVYPPGGGTDNFSRIQVRVTNRSGVVISEGSYYTLNENNADFTSLSLKEGYLATTNITFQFRGNDPNYSAYADTYYYGR